MRLLLLWQTLDEAMPIFPVYALLFADRGMTPATLSALFVLWSASSFVTEVPSGAWADTVSRRMLLGIAAIVYASAFATWALLPNLAGFAAGFVLWSLSDSLASGTFEALAYDELAAIDADDAYARVIGLGTTLSLAGMAAATLAAAPIVATFGYAGACWASVGVCGAQLLVTRALPSAPARSTSGDAAPGAIWAAYLHALRSGVSEAVGHGGVRTAVLASAGLMGLLAFDEYFGLLLDERGAAAATIPIWLTLVGAGQALGGLVAERATAWRAATWTAVVGAAGVALAAGAFVDHPAGIVGVAAGYGAMQLTIVVADVRVQERIEGGARATVTSVSNVLAEALAIVVYLIVGVTAGDVGYGTVLGVLAFLLVVAARPVARALAPRTTTHAPPADYS